MAIPDREAINTFMSITGTSEGVAVQKLQEHLCNLNEAVNTHFNEGTRNIINDTPVVTPEKDIMDVDDPNLDELQRDPFSLFSAASNLNPVSHDPNYNGGLLGQNSEFTSRAPFISHPREVREIPVEINDNDKPSSQSTCSPTVEDISETAEICGSVIIDDDENNPTSQTAHCTRLDERNNGRFGHSSRGEHPRLSVPEVEDFRPSAPEYKDIRPSPPEFENIPDYGNDVEAEMIQAAIEASKREVEGDYHNQQIAAYNDLNASVSHQRQSPLEDSEIAHAVSLSLKTAEQEKALREQGVKVGPADLEADVKGLGKSAALNGRLETGRSSAQDEAEDAEEQPLIRHSLMTSATKEVGEAGPVLVRPPSSPVQKNIVNHSQANENAFRSDEWGGISSEEQDEAVMLEAAMFGGIPEGSEYGFPYAPHQFMRPSLNSTVASYPRRPRPASPSLEARRLIWEQQDDEYLASLQADKEKELKVREEAEACRLMELAAREAALEEERLKEEVSRKKLEEEEEFERLLAAKEASLPQEPASDDENAVTLLARMPNGGRRGRRFLKFDKLQFLFDFIDIGRGVKPGTYRLVRPYPRRAFGNGESASTLNELGLTGKQEALFLELI